MARDINDWLESLGLVKYAPLFTENEIDLDAASDLTESDLKELELPMGRERSCLGQFQNWQPVTSAQVRKTAKIVLLRRTLPRHLNRRHGSSAVSSLSCSVIL